MAVPALLFEQDGPIALLTFNRPAERNALDAELLVPLADAWDVIRVSANIKAVLLTGSKDAFSTGPTAEELRRSFQRPSFYPSTDAEQQLWKDPELLDRALLRHDDLPVPLVLAVEGLCFGSGLELLHAADVSYGGTGSRFGLLEGHQEVSAQDAHELGIIDHAAPKGETLVRAWKLARKLIRHDSRVIATGRQTLRNRGLHAGT
jgi:enoyl-CoA hydratase